MSVRLSPLYLALLKELYSAGYMRTDQIEAMLRVIAERDQLPVPEKSLRRMVQKKLLAMVQAGILTRIMPPVFPDTRTGPPFYIYSLAKMGAAMLADYMGMTVGELGWRPADDVTFLFLNHVLALVDFKLALTTACLARDVELSEWVGDRELRREPAKVSLTNDTGEQTHVSIVPDAYYQLRLPSGHVLSCCLEIDRGTSTVAASKWQAKSWRRKVMAYQFLQQNGLAGSIWAAPGFIVTTVTTSPSRLAHLLTISEEAGNRFWFTTFERLNADTILGAVWQVADRGTKLHSLLPG